ncbi:hypothetical protein SALBM217S_06465 [Streptomyces griseoloalbus]
MPVEASTGPALPMPTAPARSHKGDPVRSPITAATAAMTVSPSSRAGVGRWARAWIRPSRSTSAPAILVPPMSSAATRSVLAERAWVRRQLAGGDPGAADQLFVLWLDARQLTVIDASEGVPLPRGNFRRAWLSAPDVRVELPDGSTLPGAYAYVNRRGVLHDGTGTPRTHPGQRPLLTDLLRHSPACVPCSARPGEFAARARADRALCEKGTRLFAEEGLVTTGGLERYTTSAGTGSADRPGT